MCLHTARGCPGTRACKCILPCTACAQGRREREMCRVNIHCFDQLATRSPFSLPFPFSVPSPRARVFCNIYYSASDTFPLQALFAQGSNLYFSLCVITSARQFKLVHRECQSARCAITFVDRLIDRRVYLERLPGTKI